MHVLIIGCGASGAAAAISAARAGCRVTVVDRNRKALKKLSVTGNGRGNLMNLNPPRFYGDQVFGLKVLDKMPQEKVKQFLESLGLSLTSDDEGRVYPSSYMASVAVDAFLCAMEELGVEIHQNVQIETLTREGGRFVVQGTESLYAPSAVKKGGKVKKGELLSRQPVRFTADRVILAVGGAAAPAHGTDGTAYELATGFGHRLAAPMPALSPLLTSLEPISGLEGVRVKASLRLLSSSGKTLHKTSGEALFTAEGVSGIAAMQLARFYEPGCFLMLDLTESLTGAPDTDLALWLDKRIADRGKSELSKLLLGSALPCLHAAIRKAAGLDSFREAAQQLSFSQKEQLCRAISGFRVPVLGVKGFDAAQVTAGGIDPTDVHPDTMESKLIPGLFFTGEILDVDGDCGGFNLLFAFASGLLAGKNL